MIGLLVGFVFCCGLASAELADITLKCDVNDSTDPFCTVTSFHVSHSQKVRLPPPYYSSANNTKFMKFYDSVLLYIPYRLFEAFPYLKSLDVSNTQIIDIPRNTFMSANSLSYLNISHNNITQITTSVFVGANSLLRIDLSSNVIAKLTEHAFKGLLILEKVKLSWNRIKQLEDDVFADNVFMESIALDNNQIEVLQPQIFNKLQRLRSVDLTNNRIAQLQWNTFRSAYVLNSLYLSGNTLTEFNLDLQNILNELHLDHNQLTSLVVNSTKNVRAGNNQIREIINANKQVVEKLYIPRNQLSDISNITNLTNLVSLDLSHNRVGPLNISTFEHMKHLKELYLRNSSLQRLLFGMFSKLTHLEVLDLSFNNLTNLNLNIFVPYMAKLKQFYIDGNNLTRIQGQVTFNFAFPSLAKIGLSKNNFSCSYLHSLLTPPFLSTFTELHIEPEESTRETTHIKDVACQPDEEVQSESKAKETAVLLSTINSLKEHERNLETYVLLLKISLLILFVLALLAVKFIRCTPKAEYRNSFARASSVVFRSTTTVNTSVEQ